VATRIALGNNRRSVAIVGLTRFDGGAGSFPGAALTTATNIGRSADNQFSVLPELQLKLGYNLTQHLRWTAGYTLLWWSDVARAGAAIDPAIGIDRPVRVIRDADFLAHGFTTGIEVRW
jgi:hypothetical protein